MAYISHLGKTGVLAGKENPLDLTFLGLGLGEWSKLRELEGCPRGKGLMGSVNPQQAGGWAQRQAGEGYRPGYAILGTVFPTLLSSPRREESCNWMF